MPLTPEEEELLWPSSQSDAPDLAVDLASHQDPDRSAQVLDIATRAEVPTSVVDANLEDMQRQERATAVPVTEMGPSVLDLINNPDTANVVHDDLENLKATEDALGWDTEPKGSVKRQLSDIGGHLTDIGSALYSGVIGASASLQGVPEAAINLVGAEDTAFGKYMKAQREYGQRRAEELMPQTGNHVADLVYQGLRSSSQNLITIAGTQGRGTLAAMGTMVFGDSYTRAKDQGLDDIDSIYYGLADAVSEVLTEKIPLEQLFKSIGGTDGFLKTLGKQLITELPTEQVATLLQDLNAWAVLPENSEQDFQDFLDARGQAAFDTLIATMSGTIMTTGTTYGGARIAQKAANAFDNRKAAKEDAVFRQMLQDADVLAHSETGQEKLDDIITLAQESKVNERAAQVYKDFLSGTGSDQAVFIPADIVAEMEDLPDVITSQLDGLGGDVEIPMDVFMSEIAGDETLMGALRPHMKLGGDLLTATEIEQGGDMTVRRLLERAQVAADEKTEADEIFEAVREDLVATGRMSHSAARYAARIYPAMAAVVAKEYGISPAQVYEKMGLTIVGPGAAASADATVMNQAQESGYEGQDAGEATEWLAGVDKYGAEGMTQEARMERAEAQGFDTGTTYYHGTAATGITEFRGDRGSAGHFAFESEFADDFAGEAEGAVNYPIYLSVNNTFDPRDPDHIGALEEADEFGDVSDLTQKMRDGTFQWFDLEDSLEAIKDAGFDSYLDFESTDGTPTGIAVFEQSDIRSTNAAFNEDEVNSPNILAQRQLDKRRDMLQKLRDCLAA